jgi:predicted GIY-YIG superfamily endonuclease
MKGLLLMNTIPNPQQSFHLTFPDKWLKNDQGCSKFYTYILKLGHGDLYVGHTRELKERLFEHKEGMTRSTAGENPKLKYFEIFTTREAARNRELELQHLLRTNRRELVRLMADFQSSVALVDLT